MDYINLAREGKNEWWRYVLAVFAILFGWLGVTLIIGVVLAAYIFFDNDPNTTIDLANGRIQGLAPALMFVILMLSPAALFASVLIAVRVIHQRSMRSLVTPLARLDWRRYALGFVFFFALSALGSLIEALFFPGRYALTFKLIEFLKILPLVLVFIPIQTAGEELVFRGYLMQSLGLRIRNRYVLALISGFVFMALHLGNPEVSVDALLLPAYYFSVGLLFALVTIRDNRLELALGAHAATNVFTSLIANYDKSALPTPSIFTATTLDARFGYIAFVVTAIVFYVGLFGRPKPTEATT